MDIKQTIKQQSLADIETQAARVAMMSHIRAAMLHPTAKKTAPSLSALQLAQACGVDKQRSHTG
jgi:chromosome partitioning protein